MAHDQNLQQQHAEKAEDEQEADDLAGVKQEADDTAEDANLQRLAEAELARELAHDDAAKRRKVFSSDR